MKRWKILAILIAFVAIVPWVHADSDSSPSKYDLYSWKDGNDWVFSILPTTEVHRVDAEIKHEAGPLRGLDKIKEKFLSMKEGDRISWETRSETGFVYPPHSVMQEVIDYASSVGIKIAVTR